MRQLSLNGVLLAGIVVPAAAGLIAINGDLVRLFVAPAFQPVTLVVLPISVLAGSIRNLRLHFPDQAFLLRDETRWSIHVTAIEAVLAVVLALVLVPVFGIAGAAAACLMATLVSTLASLVVAARRYGLALRPRDQLAIALASAAMAAAVRALGPASDAWMLALHVLAGGALYAALLALLFRGALGDVLGRRQRVAAAAG